MLVRINSLPFYPYRCLCQVVPATHRSPPPSAAISCKDFFLRCVGVACEVFSSSWLGTTTSLWNPSSSSSNWLCFFQFHITSIVWAKDRNACNCKHLVLLSETRVPLALQDKVVYLLQVEICLCFCSFGSSLFRDICGTAGLCQACDSKGQ